MIHHSFISSWMNVFTAGAYLILTYNLLRLLKETDILASAFSARQQTSPSKRNVLRVIICVGVMFALFIALCGVTHLLSAMEVYLSPSNIFCQIQIVAAALCSIVSVATALAMVSIYPILRDAINKFELTEEGSVAHLDSYVVEVVDLLQESIVVLSSDMYIKRGNKSTNHFFGKKFVGTNILSSVHPEDSVLFTQVINRVAAAYDTVSEKVQYRIKREDDAKKFCWVESTVCKRNGAPLQSQQSESQSQSHPAQIELFMITKDFEEQKNIELLQQKEAEIEAQKAINSAKLRYIACTAHDLKTPLQSFCFATDLLRRSKLTKEQMEYIVMADTATSLMKLTISEAMDVSKSLSGGKLQPRRGSVSVRSMLRRVQVIIDGYMKQVPITFSCAANVHDSIITDEDWLWQMQLDLLTNACKYTESGWIQLSVQLCKCSSDEADGDGDEEKETMLLFEVTDTGIGIDPATVDVLFGAFAQMQEGQSTGTGLGLYGLKTRIESLGGSCGARLNAAVESDRATGGRGSTFWFKIPYHTEYLNDLPRSLIPGRLSLDTISSIPPRLQVRTPSGQRSMFEVQQIQPAEGATLISDTPRSHLLRVSNETIVEDSEVSSGTECPLTAIVVDDSSSICKLMAKVLSGIGFTNVETYSNGSQGLEAMKRSQVDFVFSDVQMPIMTGPEMIKRFRAFEADALRSGARCKRQLVVVITANGQECDYAKLVGENAFDEFCSKPVSVNDFQKIVDEYKNKNKSSAGML